MDRARMKAKEEFGQPASWRPHKRGGYSTLFYYVKHSKIGAREVSWPHARISHWICFELPKAARKSGPSGRDTEGIAQLKLCSSSFWNLFRAAEGSEVKSPGPEGPDF